MMKALWADDYVTFEGKWHLRPGRRHQSPAAAAQKFRCGSAVTWT